MPAPKKILILGATSLIAQETARLYARDRAQFFLISRDASKLEEIKMDLKVHGAESVHIESAEISNVDLQKALFEKIIGKFPDFDMLFLAYGSLSDQAACEKDLSLTAKEIGINFTSAATFLTLTAEYFEKRSVGTIVVITSVAADRGRKKNYVYGAAKAGLDVFVQGLRNRFGKSAIKVITIKPGFVDTPMTKDFKKGPLFASAQKVASDIYNAESKGKDYIYTPAFWCLIMKIIKMIPERIFKKLNI